MALHVSRIVCFCFPHVVDVNVLSICIVLCAFVVVISMCLFYVSSESRVNPSILGLMFMSSVMLSICSSSCVLYSAGSGVKRVYVVLYGLRMRRLSVCMCVFPLVMIGCLLFICLCSCVLMLW